MSNSQLVLASASPQRQKLLHEAGYSFVIHPAHLDEESFRSGRSPFELARSLAIAKAQVVSAFFPNDIVLAADTVVALGGRDLGKPSNPAEARSMLFLLSGTTQEVITGVAVARHADGLLRERTVISSVSMRKLTEQEIAQYVASNAWEGKAGGYGIQDDDPFVTRQAGSLTNIVGLPMDETVELLTSVGIQPQLK